MRRPIPDPVATGQESVWDFPRPAVAQPTGAKVSVVFAGQTIAESLRALCSRTTDHKARRQAGKLSQQ